MSAEVATLPAPAALPTVSPEREAFELDLRKAKLLAASTLVPAQYQDNIPNAMIALNMARRIGADPLMVCQNLYIVQGKPGWSGQFLIATFNQCGRFTAMKFEWRGEQGGKEWGCRAYATERATGEKIIGAWVTWKMVEGEGWNKKSGSKWLTMPEVMFAYRAGAFLVRHYAPEIAMGLQTVEELRDVIDVEPETAAPTKADAVAAALKARLQPPETPQERPAEPQATETPPSAAAPASEPGTGESEAFALDGAPPVALEYAAVREKLERALKRKNRDLLDEAESEIGLTQPHFHAELRELVAAYRAKL